MTTPPHDALLERENDLAPEDWTKWARTSGTVAQLLSDEPPPWFVFTRPQPELSAAESKALGEEMSEVEAELDRWARRRQELARAAASSGAPRHATQLSVKMIGAPQILDAREPRE